MRYLPDSDFFNRRKNALKAIKATDVELIINETKL